MQYAIASEFGVNFGADTTARVNGSSWRNYKTFCTNGGTTT
ncbi:alpha/beta-type small acid-soluble spore protein [Priestia aryabhattai]